MNQSSAGNEKKQVQKYIDEQGREYFETTPIQYEPLYYEENGSTLIYGNDYQSLSQEIYHEEIVDGHEEYVESLPSTSTAPPSTNKNRLIKDGPFHTGTVLLTNQSLSADNATYQAKAGKRGKEDLEKPSHPMINEGGSLLNRNLPGMTSMFKVMRESALKKTEENLKGDKEDEEEEGEEEKEEDVCEGPQTPPPMEKLGEDEFQSNVFDQWPLYTNNVIDFKEACELLIGIQEIDEEKVCKTLPLQFKHEGTFLIDLQNCRDVYNDENGQWETPSGKTRFYKETEDGNLIRADDGKGRLKEWTKDYTFKIMLKRYENQVTRDADEGRGQFQKKVYTGFKGQEKLQMAIVTYSWSSGRPWNFVPPVTTRKVAKTNWEKKSYEKVAMTSMPSMASSFYEGFNIYSHCVVNFDEAAAILLGGTVVESNKLCSSVPLGYRQDGTFVIDLKRMGHCVLELRRDDNGLWSKPSGSSRFYKFAENGDAVRIDKCGKLPPGHDFDVKIMSKRYEHTQVEKKFVRKIYTARGKYSETFPGSPEYAIIVYYWKGDPIPFTPIYKQNMVRTEEKEFARYQQIADEEQEFVETSGTMDDLDKPPQLKRARFSTEDNMMDMKMTLIRREMENQDRFSAVLDRADAMLTRMEQRFGLEPVVYAPEVQHWEQVEEQIIEEEVLQQF
uniref:Ricin B-type lectin domain-containing protein n=1 Tax=Caenorhabditis tropicalis TaxID=1561998 RepID=A0A1I7T692_9PELO